MGARAGSAVGGGERQKWGKVSGGVRGLKDRSQDGRRGFPKNPVGKNGRPASRTPARYPVHPPSLTPSPLLREEGPLTVSTDTDGQPGP